MGIKAALRAQDSVITVYRDHGWAYIISCSVIGECVCVCVCVCVESVIVTQKILEAEMTRQFFDLFIAPLLHHWRRTRGSITH